MVSFEKDRLKQQEVTCISFSSYDLFFYRTIIFFVFWTFDDDLSCIVPIHQRESKDIEKAYTTLAKERNEENYRRATRYNPRGLSKNMLERDDDEAEGDYRYGLLLLDKDL